MSKKGGMTPKATPSEKRTARMKTNDVDEGLMPSTEKLTPSEKKKNVGGRPHAKNKNDREKAQRLDSFIIPDCMFPKLNQGLTRVHGSKHRGTGDYLPLFSDYVIEWSARGKSRTWIAAELRCTIPTLAKWIKLYPNFADAFEIGELLAQRYWEDNGESGMREKTFSSVIWKTIVSARFPRDWQDNKKVELGLDTSFLGLWDAVSKGATVIIADEVADATNEETPDA